MPVKKTAPKKPTKIETIKKPRAAEARKQTMAVKKAVATKKRPVKKTADSNATSDGDVLLNSKGEPVIARLVKEPKAPRPKTVNCEVCGKAVTVKHNVGKLPKYCSASHRQKAVELRKVAAPVAQAAEYKKALQIITRTKTLDAAKAAAKAALST